MSYDMYRMNQYPPLSHSLPSLLPPSSHNSLPPLPPVEQVRNSFITNEGSSVMIDTLDILRGRVLDP